MIRRDRDAVDVACAIHRKADEALTRQQFAWAQHWCRRALRILERALGAGHPDYVNVSNTLGSILEALSDYQSAEAVYRHSVEAMEAIDVDIPPVHVIRVQSLMGLGNILRIQGRYVEAEPHLRRAIALAEAHLGAEDPVFGSALNNLAVVYKYTGQFDEAEALYRRALAISEATAGPDHPDTAVIYHNLGGLAHARGAYADGEADARRAVEIRARAKGLDHPDVAADKAALAGILEGLGRWAEARQLYEEALPIYRAQFGGDHYEIAYLFSALAGVERAEGHIDRAEHLYRDALAMRERLLGPRHPDVAMTLHNFAVFLDEQDRDAEARPLTLRAREIFVGHFSPDHPKVLASQELVARL